MKGLILKDIYGCRFQIIGGFAIMLFPMIMMSLAGGGMFVADEENSLLTIVGVVVYGMVNYMSIVISSSFYLNTLSYDEKSGWTKMQRAMPLTGGQIIGGKFLGVAVIVGMLTIVSLAFNLISAVIYKMPFEPMIAMPLCLGLLEAMTLLPVIVLGYKFGAKSVSWIYFIVMGIIAAGIIALVAAFFTGKITSAALRIIAYGGIPALFAGIFTVCYVTGKKAVTVDI